jgi:hypothetical protein
VRSRRASVLLRGAGSRSLAGAVEAVAIAPAGTPRGMFRAMEHALQQIAAAVTPAVMVSACGLVALGLDNQISRMSLRVRELVREHRAEGVGAARRAVLAEQVAILDRRHGLYSRALLLDYAALLAFVVTSLAWLAQPLLRIPSEIPVVVFAAGVAMLAAMAVFVIAAIRLARHTIESEAAEVLRDVGAPAGAGGDRPARAGTR